MSKLILFATCLFLVSCDTYFAKEKFFCKVSIKDIQDASLGTVSYRTDYIDGSCVQCGTVSVPLFDYDIKYDTLSRYKVIVIGKILFKKDSHIYKTNDSIEINSLIIDRPSFPREFYSQKNNKWSNQVSWDNCPLPKRILKKIRTDFLKRKKNTRYVLNNSDACSISEMYSYLLY